MEVHNISIDTNEEDTSGDDCDDGDHDAIFERFIMPRERHQDLEASTSSAGPKLSKPPNESGTRAIFTTSASFQNQFRSWERSGLDLDTLFYASSSLQEQPESFQFFLLDTLSTVAKVKHLGIRLDSSVDGLPLHNVIRLFGVTTPPQNYGDVGNPSEDVPAKEENSTSVCCNVHGFLPYFYLLPNVADMDEEDYWTREKSDFQSWLNEEIKTLILEDVSYLEYHDFVAETGKLIARVEVVQVGDGDNNSGIYDFYETRRRPESKRIVLLKIFCTLPRFIWPVNSFIKEAQYKNRTFQCFEANLNNTMRFLADRNITGCSWLEINANKYFVRNADGPPFKESHCQIEIDVHFKDVIQLEDSHARYKKVNPPLRVLSFDIEVMTSAEDLAAPLDGRRQILQIGAVLGTYCTGKSAKDCTIGKVVFVLGTCDSIQDATVVQFYVQEKPENTNEKYIEDAEASLLGAWRDFIIQMDPDIITGYNIKKFDVPYLFDRSLVLDGFKHKTASVLPFMGKLQKVKSRIRTVQLDLKKVYEYDDKNVNIQGRLILDMYPIIVRHDKLNHGRGYYKLSSVAKRYLNKTEEKQDVAYTEIEGLQHGNSTTRNRMARYCLQDSVIPYLLLFEPVPFRRETITYLDLYFIRSRIGGPPLRYLLNKSVSYNEYFKQVRIQKNPGRAVYVPNTPSPRKPLPSPITKDVSSTTCKRGEQKELKNENEAIASSSRSVNRILFVNSDTGNNIK